MNKLTKNLLKVNHIEQLATAHSPIHDLHPLIKIFFTFLYIVMVLSAQQNLLELLGEGVLLWILIVGGHTPPMMIYKRAMVGLPLSLCLGLSNLFLMRETIVVYGFTMTNGALSMITLFIKTTLCLSAVFLLMATTRFDDIATELIHIHIPSLFVLQLLMTYRYIFVLVEEASTMSSSYKMRNPQCKGIAMKDMGSFVGSLLLRSMKRSQEVYEAMKCRGFSPRHTYIHNQSFALENYFLMMMIVGIMALIKVIL